MVAEYYGRKYTLQNLRNKSHITREGVSMLGISDAAETIGFRTMGVKASVEKMVQEQPVPFIAHWRQVHFVVVYKIERVRSLSRGATGSRTPTNSTGKKMHND
jgi:ATP-binding cassette subfamily B protein